ncbi:hypothetical protein M1145_02880 [Patescibacteria group bacterium]|nr:hypothetical protein [Patescibacteria group bacterium]
MDIDNSNQKITKKHIVKIIVLIIFVVMFIITITPISNISKELKNNTVINLPKSPSGFVAVFLTSGQVYFGKINHYDTKTLSLSDIYYLKSQPALQNGVRVNSISLIKLGGEIQGPTDNMYINTNHILFTENLTNNSKVVKSILNYQKTKSKK